MGDQRWNRWERRQEGEKPLCAPVPSDSIAGPPEPFLKIKNKKNRQNDFACFFIIYKLKSSINC